MDVKIVGNKAIITVELHEPRPSSTGKTNIVYTSGGFKAANGSLRVNITIVKG